MLNKNDPLIGAVQQIMKENSIRRAVEEKLNEELGIFNKKSLPHEHHANYDALLEERITEALKGGQVKLDVNGNKRLDKQDFKALRASKEQKPEEHGVEAEREMASKGKKIYEDPKETAKSVAKAASVNNTNKDMCEAEQLDEVGDTKRGREFMAKVAAKHYGKNAYKSPTKETETKLAKVDRVWAKHDKEDDKVTGKKTIRTSSPLYDYNEEVDLEEAKYSAKAGRAGEDLGKPGKNFSKIADKAAKRYGSEESGKRVAGAILAKIRAKHMEEETQLDEKAPEGAKYERMVKHIKQGYSKDGELTAKEKGIAYATAWKAKKKAEMKESVSFEEIMEEIAFNLNEKAKEMLKAPFHEAAEWFNSLNEEQVGMLDEGLWDNIKSAASSVGNAVSNAFSGAPSAGSGSQMGGTPAAVKTQTTQATAPQSGGSAAGTAARVGDNPGSAPKPAVQGGSAAGTAARLGDNPGSSPAPAAAAPAPAAKPVGTASYSGSQMGGTPAAVKTQTQPTMPKPASSGPNVVNANAKPGEDKMAQAQSAPKGPASKPVSDTDVMNDPRFKQGLSSVGGTEGAKKIQGGQDVSGVGKVAQGSTLMDTMRQKIAGERAAGAKLNNGGSGR